MIKRQVFIAVVLAWFLGGCAVFESKTPEEVVAERAEQRLTLLITGGLEESYELTSPGYRRRNTIEQYAADFGGRMMWTAIEVKEVECLPDGEPTYCDVVVLISYRAMRQSYVQTTEVTEKWIKSGRDWFAFPD